VRGCKPCPGLQCNVNASSEIERRHGVRVGVGLVPDRAGHAPITGLPHGSKADRGDHVQGRWTSDHHLTPSFLHAVASTKRSSSSVCSMPTLAAARSNAKMPRCYNQARTLGRRCMSVAQASSASRAYQSHTLNRQDDVINFDEGRRHGHSL
jgi:hypothetical protein